MCVRDRFSWIFWWRADKGSHRVCEINLGCASGPDKSDICQVSFADAAGRRFTNKRRQRLRADHVDVVLNVLSIDDGHAGVVNYILAIHIENAAE